MNTTTCKEIQESNIGVGNIGVWWLGQSGYVFKNSFNEIIYVDPYLTDTISNGYRPYIHARLIPPVVQPEDDIDVLGVLLSHDHQDHMDPNTIVILSEKDNLKFYGSKEVCSRLRDVLDIDADKTVVLSDMHSTHIGHYEVYSVKAVHSPGAIGLVIRVEGITLYLSGDTVLFGGMKAIGSRYHIDLAFLCFNGQAGNMDVSGALHAVKLLGPKKVIPCHYGMYADNTGDPQMFAYRFMSSFPEKECIIMEAGKKHVISL